MLTTFLKHSARVGAMVAVAATGHFAFAESAPDVPQGWQRSGKVGLYLDIKGAKNYQNSLDTNISEGENSANITSAGEATFTYTSGVHQTEHRIELRYSLEKAGGQSSWVEDDDLIEYRGVYRRYWNPRTFAYGSGGVDSVFTGPEPQEHFMNPTELRGAAGVGQLYLWGNWKNSFEYRVGVRAQDQIGSDDYIDPWERDVEVGPDALLHYIVGPDEKINFYARLEAFTRFDDTGNVQLLLTSGFSYKMLKFLALDLYFRSYYEGRPEDAPESALGYDEISYRNSLQLGLTYSF